MIKVTTAQFKRAHGHNPKGFGAWAFRFSNGQDEFFTGMYSDAKKEAIKFAQENHLNRNTDIKLMS